MSNNEKKNYSGNYKKNDITKNPAEYLLIIILNKKYAIININIFYVIICQNSNF